MFPVIEIATEYSPCCDDRLIISNKRIVREHTVHHCSIPTEIVGIPYLTSNVWPVTTLCGVNKYFPRTGRSLMKDEQTESLESDTDNGFKSQPVNRTDKYKISRVIYKYK